MNGLLAGPPTILPRATCCTVGKVFFESRARIGPHCTHAQSLGNALPRALASQRLAKNEQRPTRHRHVSDQLEPFQVPHLTGAPRRVRFHTKTSSMFARRASARVPPGPPWETNLASKIRVPACLLMAGGPVVSGALLTDPNTTGDPPARVDERGVLGASKARRKPS